MKDDPDMDMPMSGDGEVTGEEPVMEPSEDIEEKPTREKPLKIRGTLNDVLKVAMKPKVKQHDED